MLSRQIALRGTAVPAMSMMAAGIILYSIGCTPSVRYTRGGGTALTTPAHTYKVPRGWDYRKSYALPQDRVAKIAASYLGVRYRWGGMKRSGTDCSGFVCMVYRDVCRAKMPHSSRTQHELGRKVSLQDAKCGDLVFFRGGMFNRINHVGIFISGKQFIHASTKHGVMYSNLDDAYYRARFVDVRRIFK